MSTNNETPRYYVPESSPWPIVGAVALFITAFGGAHFIQQSTDKVGNDGTMGWLIFAAGVAMVLFMMWGWWKNTISESLANMNSAQLSGSYRQGMLPVSGT